MSVTETRIITRRIHDRPDDSWTIDGALASVPLTGAGGSAGDAPGTGERSAARALRPLPRGKPQLAEQRDDAGMFGVDPLGARHVMGNAA